MYIYDIYPTNIFDITHLLLYQYIPIWLLGCKQFIEKISTPENKQGGKFLLGHVA